MFKKFSRAGLSTFIVSLIIFFISSGAVNAAPEFTDTKTKTDNAPKIQREAKKEVAWYWLGSDNKYSKYFDPDSVKVVKKTKVVRKVKGENGAETSKEIEVATEIEAWTKTTYTYEGADETIKNYEISEILPDPKALSYSLALLKVNPQTRTIQYAREDFYNADDVVIWSKNDGRIKEINSQSFDEDFYAAIVDEVFRHGEVDRKNAKDRWIDLWTYTDSDGSTTSVTADTTTMQAKGTNLIVWEWQETKNSAGQTTEIRFMKKSVNLPQGTERIVNGTIWTVSTRKWNELDDEYGGAYRMIKNDEPEYKGLVRLRAYARGYSTWVNRYSIS